MTDSSESIVNIVEALAAFQGAVEPPQRTKTATIQGKTRDGDSYKYEYKYAPLEEITRTIRAPMAENGLCWRQAMARDPTVVRTYIMHKSGEWFSSDYPVMPTKEGHQGLASGVTLARRYGLNLALGLAAEDDDDANVADEQAAKTHGKPASLRPAPAIAPHNPETGEAGPHTITVQQSDRGIDWIGWGKSLIAGIKDTVTLGELAEWHSHNILMIEESQRRAPQVHRSVLAALEAGRRRLVDPALASEADASSILQT